MKNFILDISYDGNHYSGWQRQKNKRSVQGTIEKVLKKILKEKKASLTSASRTDAGAHAVHQIANFKLSKGPFLKPEPLLKALNAVLPSDIRINSLRSARADFHARYWAKKREYHYLIYNHKINSPFYQKYAYYYPKSIDLNLLRKTLSYFKGRHDFAPFANLSKTNVKTTVRTLYQISYKKKGPLITIILKGDGFLKGMIRNIIGSVLAINKLKQNPSLIKEIFRLQKRTKERLIDKSGSTVPAYGLYLYRVYY
ncbi:MAG: tRNA pseudouridine(38-40) synthase TruA [Spirochaetes bacterium]|nr:tRNA pseudouridine(38-40) synthase TruA [Spirochaetota bacterium]